MARYLDASCRLCRREGDKLFLKGDRCYTDKCSVEKRAYPPGQHTVSKVKLSDYGVQLREKQKVKRLYGVLERQFRKYVKSAVRSSGVSGENLLRMLESRLDNVVYRMGLSTSRNQARQMIKHCLISVNGRRVDVPSFQVKAGDLVSLTTNGTKHKLLNEIVESTSKREIPSWLQFDSSKKEGKVVEAPTRDSISVSIKEQYIIELYSR